MPIARLKAKRQITVPAKICRQVQADQGDIFDFEVDGDKIVMRLQRLVPATKQKSSAEDIGISQYIGIAKGTFGSAAEIDDYIRSERAA